MNKLSEMNMAVAREYGTALAVEKQIEFLEESFCKIVSDYWNGWIDENLGKDWDHENYSLEEDDTLCMGMRKWVPDEEHDYDEQDWIIFLSVNINDPRTADEHWWLEWFLGLPPKGNVVLRWNLDEAIKTVGSKEKVLELLGDIKDEFLKAGYSEAHGPRKKKTLYFDKPIVLDRESLISAFETGDYEAAFASLNEGFSFLQEIASRVDSFVDAVKSHARGGGE